MDEKRFMELFPEPEEEEKKIEAEGTSLYQKREEFFEHIKMQIRPKRQWEPSTTAQQKKQRNKKKLATIYGATAAACLILVIVLPGLSKLLKMSDQENTIWISNDDFEGKGKSEKDVFTGNDDTDDTEKAISASEDTALEDSSEDSTLDGKTSSSKTSGDKTSDDKASSNISDNNNSSDNNIYGYSGINPSDSKDKGNSIDKGEKGEKNKKTEKSGDKKHNTEKSGKKKGEGVKASGQQKDKNSQKETNPDKNSNHNSTKPDDTKDKEETDIAFPEEDDKVDDKADNGDNSTVQPDFPVQPNLPQPDLPAKDSNKETSDTESVQTTVTAADTAEDSAEDTSASQQVGQIPTGSVREISSADFNYALNDWWEKEQETNTIGNESNNQASQIIEDVIDDMADNNDIIEDAAEVEESISTETEHNITKEQVEKELKTYPYLYYQEKEKGIWYYQIGKKLQSSIEGKKLLGTALIFKKQYLVIEDGNAQQIVHIYGDEKDLATVFIRFQAEGKDWYYEYRQ